jgi:formate dehydrogenase assembly factor FdhD
MNTIDVPIVRFKDQKTVHEDDAVVAEEPLEIFIDDEPYYVTMRLPGEELPLAVGLCHSEGIIDSIDDTVGVNYARTSPPTASMCISPRPEGTGRGQIETEAGARLTPVAASAERRSWRIFWCRSSLLRKR